MKKHAGSKGSTANRKGRKQAKRAERERAYRKAHNVLTRNLPSYRRKRAREDHPWRPWISRRGVK
jgi:hypothetical protein